MHQIVPIMKNAGASNNAINLPHGIFQDIDNIEKDTATCKNIFNNICKLNLPDKIQQLKKLREQININA